MSFAYRQSLWVPPPRKDGKPRPGDKVLHPLIFKDLCWPHIQFYGKQEEIAQSLLYNEYTIVPGANMLGKDFFTAFAVLWFFLTRHPCRVVTTSVDATQLEGVLWGEMQRLIGESNVQLPLEVIHQKIKKFDENGDICDISYILGRVSAKGEGIQGHHVTMQGDGIPRTLFVADEASAVQDKAFEAADTWARSHLYIGNCMPCSNRFRRDIRTGDIKSTIDPDVYHKKIIRIKAEDSPNVRIGLIQEARGEKPDNTLIIPGPKDYFTYKQQRETWDPIKQCISLDAEFWEGAETLLCPPDWLNKAEKQAAYLSGKKLHIKPTHMSVDSAAGNDDTTWTMGNHWRVTRQLEEKTPNTTRVFKKTIALIKKYHLNPENVIFDSGGGGKQHADRLREAGYNVRLVNFGESVKPPQKATGQVKTRKQREKEDEERFTYKDRRSQMYGLIREAIDPANEIPWGLGEELIEFRQQIAPIPLLFDDKGRLFIPPKRRKSTLQWEGENTKKVETLQELLGRSPDHADGVAMLRFALVVKRKRLRAGVV